MILLLIGLLLVFAGLAVIAYIATWKPEMHVDSWGEPDPAEACGNCCLAMVILAFALVAIFIGVSAIAHGGLGY